MLTPSERKRLFFYLRNLASRIHRASPEARGLVQWVAENRKLLELEFGKSESEEIELYKLRAGKYPRKRASKKGLAGSLENS